MEKKLVVVESPAKAKTINKILGKDYVVKSSMGHIRDLPVKSLGVDVEHDFAPSYEVVKSRKKVVGELEDAAKDCDAIFLAPDPDREGEAIAWHLKELLGKKKVNKGKPFYRVTYNEITPRAVRQAFENPTEINMRRVDAQQARRVVDRIVGYKVSPLLWRRVQRGLSAGRVQSVALRLVCEREAEIKAFVPEPYWVFGASVRKMVTPMDPFNLKLTRIDGEKAEIKTEELAGAISKELDGCTMRVSEIKTKRVRRKPYPPFITSTLQQAASTFCRFSPKQTMSIAQKLYEGVNLGDGPTGLITYMRTDSVNLSADAVQECRGFIEKKFGKDYLPEKPTQYRSRGGAQEAHEAIRPTDVTRTPEKMKSFLDPQGLKLYRLIWERFVACQMTPAQIDQRTVLVEAGRGVDDQRKVEHQYLFSATASEVKFDGYRRVIKEKDKKEDDSDQVDTLPVLAEDEPLVCLELLSEQKETKPPSRYSEASLVKALEANGVGRPSTYAQILSTLQQRNYVESIKRTLHPTGLGMKTSDFLVADLGDLFDVQFTADMESRLDRIEEGDENWVKMLERFYGQFEKWMEGTKVPPADPAKIKRLLAAMDGIKEWAPPVKRGKRTYSDEKFASQMADSLENPEKPASERQLEALAKIAARYREEVPDIVTALEETGFGKLLEEPLPEPPRESSTLKLEALEALDLDEKTRSFVESLHDQVRGNRRLSDNQLRALNRMVMGYSKQIEDFESKRSAMDLEGMEAPPEDNESGELLELMTSVSEWNAPVKRGKREFNDQSFYESLKGQFEQRKSLSERQRAALKKMVRRYREQIPSFAEVEDRLGLQAPPPRARASRSRSKAKAKS